MISTSQPIDANSGSFTSAMRAGGTGDDAGRSVTIDFKGTIAQVGDFEFANTPSSFEPFNLISNGSHDMFVARIGLPSCVGPTVSISATGATTFCEGGSVTLTASATGSNLFYQWKKNGVDIIGATANSFVATTLGDYKVSASNICGAATSGIISVTLKNSPKATITPSGIVSMCAGDQTLLAANTGNNLSYQWMKNSIAISGATNSTYAATTGGKFSVKVTKNATGCSSISATTKVKITCKTIETPEVSADEVLLAYPNPSAGQFTVQFHDGNAYDLQITDALGNKVQTYRHIESSFSFGSELKPGMYMLQVISNNNTVRVLKLVKTEK
jgi:hypothetical protein